MSITKKSPSSKLANVALVTFIYPAVEPFFKTLVENINQQDEQDFHVIIFNDAVLNADPFFSDLRVPYQIIEVEGSIMDVRFYALEFLAQQEYSHFVFQDSDDLMSLNRISSCSRWLNRYPLVVNDVDLMDSEGVLFHRNYWKPRLGETFEFDHVYLNDKNIAGLGNSAIHKSLLEPLPLKVENEVVAVDWLLFYQMLNQSQTNGIFISECSSFYRQHFNNSAGLSPVNMNRIIKALRVKVAHYEALSSIGFSFDEYLGPLKKLLPEEKLDISKELPSNPFWWEETNFIENETN